MKAIETYFDGRRFRSRLEARWACFFKSLGLEYRYEPEGYELNGHLYLPDFLLPEIPLWVEVKGEQPTNLECLLMSMLAGHTEIRGTIVGQPENIARTMYFEDGGDDEPYYFCQCADCGKIGFQYNGYGNRIKCCSWNEKVGIKYFSNDTERIRTAYCKAMTARFEHGEKPAV